MRGDSDDATVSLEVEWSGVLSEGEVRDTKERFHLNFVNTDCTVKWSGTNEEIGFSFESEVGNRATSEELKRTKKGPGPFVILGEETNGAFFT